MSRETFAGMLCRIGACAGAVEWSKRKSIKTAWATCERGNWMIWLLSHENMVQDDKRLRLLACDIAESVLHLVPKDEDRPRKALEAARGFVNGTVTAEEMAAAQAAACAAAGAAARAAARAAAQAAAQAAAWAAAGAAAGAAAWNAAGAAAWNAAWVAAGVATWNAAWVAAGVATWDAAWYAANKQHADLVRKWFPAPPEEKK